MGPQRIPLVHNRAFGHAAIFQPAARMVERRIQLGEPPGPTISGSELRYRRALTHYQGVQRNYPNLVTLMGEGDAQAALEESKTAYEAALRDYMAEQPTRL